MNALLVSGMLALLGFGGYAVADCNDLAGQGYLCAEVDEGGADIELFLEPQPPVAVLAAECFDLGGQGYVCADVGDDGVDAEVFIEPQPPVRANAECLGEPGLELCADDSGASWDIDQDGLQSSGAISIS